MVGNGLYLPGLVEGNKVSFLVDTGSGVSNLAARTWRKWSRSESKLIGTGDGCALWKEERSCAWAE